MGVLAPVFSSLLLFSGCAKVSYVLNQGVGQLKLQNNGQDNDKVLKDPLVKEKDKEKIRKIGEYKDYFFSYFNQKRTAIYSKTSILKQEAVSYLVIASQYDEVKAKEEKFPFVGKFPYLGFFDEKDAISHQKKLELLDYITWRRPVYAYSTLGYLTDNILSSFFYYNEFDMAEMIFHELFHTVFFIKNEVDLSENIAKFN